MAASSLAVGRSSLSFGLIMSSTAISGVAALLYQIAWVRVLVPIIGLDFFAVSAVATGTLLGLAIGSYLFGILSDRARNKLLIYLALEILIPLSGLLLLWAVRVFTPDINVLLRASDSAIVTMLLQFVFGGLVVLIPSLFMGGTLPALIGLFYSGKKGGRNDVSLIYAVNTAGSAFSALALSWLLIGWMGVTNTFLIAGGLNIASALLVIGLFSANFAPPSTSRADRLAERSAGSESVPDEMRFRLLLCYLIVGFGGLGFQQVVYRLTTFLWGAATAQYSFVIGMFLIGLVAGAVLVFKAGPRSRRFGANVQSIAWLTAVSALAIIASIFVVAFAHRYLIPTELLLSKVANGGLGNEFAGISAQLAGLCLAGLLAIALPMVFSGAIYPIVNHLLASSTDRVGLWTGLTLLTGIFGSLLGSLITTYVLLPLIGFPATLAVLAGLMFVAGRLATWRVAADGSDAAWSASILPRRRLDMVLPAVIAVSAFVPNSTAVSYLSGEQVTGLTSGITGFSHTAWSREENANRVYINGKIQGRVELLDGRHTRVMLAKAMVSDAKRILLIGLGDGQNLYYLSQYFQDAEITVVEINREVTPLLLANDRFSWMREGFNGRFKLVYEDGRFFLKQNPTQYDLIVTMAIRSGDDYSSFLYSKEFLELVSARLTPGGSFIAMFSPYTAMMGRMVGATFANVFPDVAQAHKAGIMVASNATDRALEPVTSEAAIARVCEQPLPRGLDAFPLARCRKEIGSLVRLDRGTSVAPLVLDDRPRNEFYFLQ